MKFPLDKLKTKRNKNVFLGIEVLRMILSFLIVVVHCHNKNGEDIKFQSFSFTALPLYFPTFLLFLFIFHLDYSYQKILI